MRRPVLAILTLSILASTAGATEPRHLVVPPAGVDVDQLVAQHAVLVLERYPDAAWIAGSADALRADGAFVKTIADWDLIRTVQPFRTSERESLTTAQRPGLYLVHFRAPIKAEWAAAVRGRTGVTVVQSFPNLAMVIHVASAGMRFDTLPGVDWAGELEPEWRVSPHVTKAPAGSTGRAVVMMVNAPNLEDTLRRLGDLGVAFTLPERLTAPWFPLRGTGGRELVGQVAALEHVLWIEPDPDKVMHDEVQALALSGQHTSWQPDPPGYKAWLASVGLDDLSTVVVDVADDGWDTGDMAVGNHHPDFDDAAGATSRVIYLNDLCGDGNHGAGGHGTINMAIAFGDGAGTALVDPDGYSYGTGVAPTARGGNTKIFNDGGSFCPTTMTSITSPAQAAGAHITSNSWGAATYGGYNADAAEYDLLVRDANNNPGDGLQEFTIVFSAGNSGPADGQTGSPGTAKNVITSGASENVRDDGQLDGCGDSNADSFQDLTDFTSPGPTEDGRIKPDAVSPGNHVQGAASQWSGFDGSSVCGGPDNDFAAPPGDAYWPPGQTWYTWSSGTSHSCPGMAGTAALIYEWYLDEYGATPSPAMNKAIMLAGSDDIAGGADGNGGVIAALPNSRQGWGLVNLSRVIDAAGRYAFDQEHVFTSSGEDFTPVPLFTVVDPTEPVRIMLAYTDAPGNPNATPTGGLGNDLDLEVTAAGDVYLGNSFSGGFSQTGGTADAVNNVEAVYLPPGAAGTFSVRVIASSVADDAIPGDGVPVDQDFALFIVNATDQSSDGVVALDGTTFSCASTVGITVSDQDLQGAGTQAVEIFSDTEPAPETVVLNEDPAGSGLFTGSIPTTADPAAADGQLSVAHADTITVSYLDADTGGGSGATKTATATVDCQGPQITAVGVDAASITESEAVVEWLTDEPATSTVRFGTTAPPTTQASVVGVRNGHAVTLSGLQPCSSYLYEVTSCDRWGNCTTDTAAGSYYTFTSGQKLSYFADDVEGGENGWTADPPWAITDADAHSPTHSWTDSPGGDYASSIDVSLTSPVIDLSGVGVAELRFWHRYDLETSYDYGYLEGSLDGSIWSNLATFNGTQGSWTEEVVDLSSWTGSPTLQLRFRLDTDGSVVRDGWYVDDIEISAFRSCSTGVIALDRVMYACGDPVEVTVVDLDLNADPGVVETATVTVASDSEPGGETVLLAEDGADSSYFVGTVTTTIGGTAGDGQLAVAHLDQVTASYDDADDGTGTPATVEATASMDCIGPAILDFQVVNVGIGSATVSWTTDEPADTVLDWHTDNPPDSGTISDPELVTDHVVVLYGLEACTPHYVQASSTDIVGQSATSAELRFVTPGGIPAFTDSTDTPRAIPDASGMTSRVTVSESGPVGDVDVMVDITHPFVADLDLQLIAPDGTRVNLSRDNGGSGADYDGTIFDDEAPTAIGDGSAPFSGSFRPEEPLSVLDGIEAGGNWWLQVVDDTGTNVGTLDSWQLRLQLQGSCPLFEDGFETGDTTTWSSTEP